MGKSWQKVISSVTITGVVTEQNSRAIDMSKAENIIGVKAQIESGTAPEIQILSQTINSGQEDAKLIGGAADQKAGITTNDWLTQETGGPIFSSLKSIGTKKTDGHAVMPTHWMRIQAKGINLNGIAVVSVWILLAESY